MRKSVKNASWYPYAVAVCIGVLLYVFLTQFSDVKAGFSRIMSYFSPVILGCVIAYIVNPLANLFKDKIFCRIGRKKSRDMISNACAFLVVAAFLTFALIILIPQLISSVSTFSRNFDGYVDSLEKFVNNLPIRDEIPEIEKFIGSSEEIFSTISEFLAENVQKILSTSVVAAKTVFNVIIAVILSVYLLGSKDKLKYGVKRLVKASFGEEKGGEAVAFIKRCNAIFKSYIVYNLIDALIVGTVNALFMTALGMQYAGLVSFMVGLMNLVPTFGPVIGALLGGFILVMVNPMDALIFLIFTVLLQIVDGYILKPKLFGNSLGVSGLWILIAIIVGGAMFGVPGILLAIPVVAILDFMYNEFLIPALEKRHMQGPAEDDGEWNYPMNVAEEHSGELFDN